MQVYFGTYVGEAGRSIFCATLDLEAGALSPPVVVGGVPSPSFLAMHPGGARLYSVAEVGRFDGEPGGAVAAYAIDPATGALNLLNTATTRGPAPCHVAVSPDGRTAIASNWSGGSVASYPIRNDGSLAPIATFIQHEGDDQPHAHSATFDASGRFVIVADMGLDVLKVYVFDPATSELRPHDPPGLNMPAGSGPRHFKFDAAQKFAYVINELAATVTAMRWDAQRGTLTPIQTVSTLPEDFEGRKWCAELVIHPNGRFLYASNRGHDSLAIYAIDPDAGTLTPLGHQPSGGKEPRNFNIDPTGAFLLAANHKSDSVQVFRIDPKAGTLTPAGAPVAAPAPVCVAFLPR